MLGRIRYAGAHRILIESGQELRVALIVMLNTIDKEGWSLKVRRVGFLDWVCGERNLIALEFFFKCNRAFGLIQRCESAIVITQCTYLCYLLSSHREGTVPAHALIVSH